MRAIFQRCKKFEIAPCDFAAESHFLLFWYRAREAAVLRRLLEMSTSATTLPVTKLEQLLFLAKLPAGRVCP